MPRTRYPGLVVPVLVALALGATLQAVSPARATEPRPSPVEPVPIHVAASLRADRPGTPILVLPPGWLPGDVAAVLAPGSDWPAGQRDRLARALLDAGAGVLELRGDGLPEAALRAHMAHALHALHEVFAVGFVVAIGRGGAGDVALAACAEAETAEGRRYAAAVRLGPGAPEFQRGEVPDGEAWPVRAPLFCDILAAAQPGPKAEFATACRTGLAPAP